MGQPILDQARAAMELEIIERPIALDVAELLCRVGD
jgi:hypothetical protein